MRLLATVLTATAVAGLLAGQTHAASAKQEKCSKAKQGIEFYRGKTWVWQERLDTKKTRASLKGRQLQEHHGCAYLTWVSKLWQKRAEGLRHRFVTLHASPYSLSTDQLYERAQWEIAHGGIYSHAWGAVSPRLQEACYELVNREFSRFGTGSWAVRIVRRESGCNPAAVNYTYSDPGERATGLSQMIPNVHRWVDYGRVMRDMRYSIAVFIRLSDGGRSTGPWCLC